jgi:hypothetical protein
MVSYVFVRKLKDNAKVESVNSTSNPWQNKLYNKPMIKKFVDLFIPKKKTKEYRAKVKLLKDSASKMKLEWMYVNKITLFIAALIITLLISFWAHAISKDYVFTEPTADYNILGNLRKSG